MAYQSETCLRGGWEDCPRYQAAAHGAGDPRPDGPAQPARAARALSPRLLALLVIGVLLLLGVILYLIFGPGLPAINIPALALDIGLIPGQSPTATPTATVQVSEPTAMASATPTETTTITPTDAPTSTPTSSPSATASPSATPTWTRTPLPTATRTPTLEPTATPSPVPTATARPRPTATRPPPQPTRRPTATSTPMPAPVLVSPSDGQTFAESADITLTWWSANSLPRNAYYVVSVAYSHQGDTWYDDVPWTDNTSWALSDHRYLVDLSDDGLFRWSVQVFWQTRVDAQGKPVGVPFSAPSEVRTLLWRPSSPGGGAPSTPTPPPP